MITAYVRRTLGDPPHEIVDRLPVEVIEEPTGPETPAIIREPVFGLYGIGIHPEHGPLAMYLEPTPGLDPEPARCELIDGRFEVPLIGDRLVLVVEDHPGASPAGAAATVADSPEQPPEEAP